MVTTSVDTNALTDLCSAKRHMSLGTNSDDLLLTSLINQVSARIETIASRRFKARDYRLWCTPRDTGTIVLDAWPVVYVNRISSGSKDSLSVSYSGSAIRATAQVYRSETGQTGGVRLTTYDSVGAITTSELTAASNASTNAMATAISAVSGWTGTAVVNIPTLDLHTGTGRDALGKTIQLTSPDQDDDHYRVDYENGIIELVDRTRRFWRSSVWPGSRAASYQSLLVDCRLGFETIPSDIELLANDAVQQAFALRSKDVNVTSESIGDYSYSLADQSMVNETITSKLSKYKRISVGSR